MGGSRGDSRADRPGTSRRRAGVRPAHRPLSARAAAALPPHPLVYQGRDLATRYLATTAFRPDRRSRLIPARANGQPAFGVYIQDPQARVWHAAGLIVLTLTGSKVSAMTGFDTSVLPHFGLPRTL